MGSFASVPDADSFLGGYNFAYKMVGGCVGDVWIVKIEGGQGYNASL